ALKEAFRQFGIETCEFPRTEVARLNREKFDACALRLDAEAEAVLHLARNSPSNRRIVIYALGGSVQDVMRLSRYGVNAVLPDPVDRQEALRVVRATRLLVLHELRCYVRVPLVTQMALESPGHRWTAATQEVSAGGMSLTASRMPPLGQAVELSFELPGTALIQVRATVRWSRDPEHLFGARFDHGDERRLSVRAWIDDYLNIP
ncbi:MAG: PilZ domain-containing protein, partial [Terriglobales bacterium]